MIYDVPPQYANELASRWNAFQNAQTNGSPTLIATARKFLDKTLDKCSDLLAMAREPRPSVISVDSILKLEYAA